MNELKQLANPAILGLFGVILSALIGYILGMRKVRMEYRGNIGMEVWKTRKIAYAELLKLMKLFSKWPSRMEVATYQDLVTLGESFKNWYFAEGGLFLTETSKLQYFKVQIIVEEMLKGNQDKTAHLGKNIYERLRMELSSLRSELTNDLLSRKRDILSKKDEKIKMKLSKEDLALYATQMELDI